MPSAARLLRKMEDGMELRDAAVVITGASSGIGRATALEFSRRGSKLVLAARRGEVIEEVADECRHLGAQAVAVQTDVTDQDQVTRLAERAVEAFGRIDVWVNDAGVMMLASFADSPADSYRRVIETNLWGTIHGARAALPVFRRQRRGVLINVSSMVADVSQPYASAYEISKHGIRALGSSLRQELLLEGQKDVHVCTVIPAVVDTPLFQHSANYTGRAARALPPAFPAEKVALAIVRFAEKPGRETFVGGTAWLMHFQKAIAPGLTERQIARIVDRRELDDDRPVGPSNGNLFAPMEEGKGISGGWTSESNGVIAKAAAGAAALVGLAILVRKLTARSQPPPPRNAFESVARTVSGAASKARLMEVASSILGGIVTLLPAKQMAEVLAGIPDRLPGRQPPSGISRLTGMVPTRQVVDTVSGLSSKVPAKALVDTVGGVPSRLSDRMSKGRLLLVGARRG